MTNMPIQWKIKEHLEKKGVTTYQFWKASGLAKRTVYRLVNGETHNLNTDTLDVAIRTLRDLTEQDLSICDLLEWNPNDA